MLLIMIDIGAMNNADLANLDYLRERLPLYAVAGCYVDLKQDCASFLMFNDGKFINKQLKYSSPEFRKKVSKYIAYCPTLYNMIEKAKKKHGYIITPVF